MTKIQFQSHTISENKYYVTFSNSFYHLGIYLTLYLLGEITWGI